MFKGFQEVMKKQPPKREVPHDPDLMLVKMADELLNNDKAKEAIKKFPNLLSLSAENFDSLCKSLINNYAEFVQELPETRGGYFCLKGGILEHALRRSSIALSILRSYFLPNGDEKAPLTQPQTLWAYAIFTAGMLQGIGKVAVDLHAELYDRSHRHLKEWSPLDGSMVTNGAYYKYDFDNPFPDDFRNRATLLLARQLMPVDGFRWLASNKDLFAIWLALLDDDHRGARNLGPILWRADLLAIQEFYDQHGLVADPKLLEGLELPEGEDIIPPEKAADAVAAFQEWLKEKLKSKEFSLGDGPVVAVPGGAVLITNSAFQLFVRESLDFKNWQAVQTAFTGLGIHQIGSTNEIFQQYIRIHDKTSVSGLVVNQANILPKDMKSVAASTRYAKATTANTQSQKFIATNGKLTSEEPAVQNSPQAKSHPWQ